MLAALATPPHLPANEKPIAGETTKDTPASPWNSVVVSKMRTATPFGIVTLTPSRFVRQGAEWRATYSARVWPWAFKSEAGTLVLPATPNQLAQLQSGTTTQFSVRAANQDGAERRATCTVKPSTADHGQLTLKLSVDGWTLKLRGHYQLAVEP